MSAMQTHHGCQTEILTLLDKIRDHVVYHADGEVIHWGHVGELSEARDILKDLEKFLKDKV